MLLPLGKAHVLRRGEGCGFADGFFHKCCTGSPAWQHPCSDETAIEAATRVINFIWNSASVSVADTNG